MRWCMHEQDVKKFGYNLLRSCVHESSVDLIIHVEIRRCARAPRVAVAAKDVRLGGDALGCIRAGVGE